MSEPGGHAGAKPKQGDSLPSNGRENSLATTRPWPRIGRLRKVGPSLLIVAALVAAGIVATTQSKQDASLGSTGSASAPANLADDSHLPITYQMAKKAGTTADYHWVTGCDF